MWLSEKNITSLKLFLKMELKVAWKMHILKGILKSARYSR
jgi:hypothetical protein